MNDSGNAMLHLDVISATEDFASLQGTWNALLAQSASNTYFLRWEWLFAWWAEYGGRNDSLCIVRCRRGGETVGIAPFYVRRDRWNGMVPYRRLMFLGTQERGATSEYLDLICRRGEERACAAKVAEFIISGDACDDAALQKTTSASALVALLRQGAGGRGLLYRREERYACPYIELPREYGAFAASLSRSLRAKICRDTRRLLEYPRVRFRKTESAEGLAGDFEELVRLHQARWVSRGRPGAFSSGRFLRFQRRVMGDMMRNGHLDLWLLSVGDRAISAQYNIKYDGKIYFYQSGLDADFDRRVAAGLLLHDHAIRDAIESGVREYDLLLMGDTDGYKLKLSGRCRYVCDVYVARAAGMKILRRLEDRARASYRGIKAWRRQADCDAC